MTHRTRWSVPGLFLRHITARPAAAVLLAVLVGAAVLVTAIAPRALSALADRELQYELAALPPLRSDISAFSPYGIVRTAAAKETADDVFGPTDAAFRRTLERIEPPLVDLMGSPLWMARIRAQDATPVDANPLIQPSVSLVVELGWADRVRIVDGVPPAMWEGSSLDALDPGMREPIDIALSADAAKQMGVEAGDSLAYITAPLRVAAIYEPLDPEDPYWDHAPETFRASSVRTLSGVTLVSAGAYIDPGSGVGLLDEFYQSELRAWYPTVPETIDYDELPEIDEQLRELTAQGIYLDTDTLVTQTGLITSLERVVERVTAAFALIALAVSAPFGVVFAVLALGVRAVIAQRMPALALASARGASGAQLRLAMLLEGALIALPVSALAIAGALLLPATLGAVGLIPAVIVALSVPALFAATTPAPTLRARRSDLASRIVRGRRLIAEIAVVGVAALSVFLLARRGLVETSAVVGVDPLLSAMPLLLSLAACVVVLRAYPLPLVGLLAASRRSRGVVGLMGAAQAVREPSSAFASVLAVVAGVSASVFSLIVIATMTAGLASAAQEEVGADIQLRGDLGAVLAEVEAIPGVDTVAAIETRGGSAIMFGMSRTDITVVYADTAELHAVRPDIPRLVRDGALPFLASPKVDERLADDRTELGELPALRVGTLPEGAIPGISGNWVLVDDSERAGLTTTAFRPTLALVSVADDAEVQATADTVREALEAAGASDIEVTDAETLTATNTGRPTTSGLLDALLLAALGSLILGALTVVIGSVIAAGARNRSVGVLRMLGMAPRQVSALVVWEFAPLAATAVLAGTALGLVLPVVVTGVVDLRAFVGGTDAATPVVPWILVAGVVVGFAVVALAAALIAAAVSRGRDAAATLRIGTE